MLAAAAEILAEIGPADFTLAHAASRAGASAATYVKRFGSKQSLFAALNQRWVDAIGPGLEAVTAGRSGLDRVREAALWGVAEMDVPEHAANMLATLALDLADAELRTLLDHGWTLQHRWLTSLLVDAAHDGVLTRAPEPEQAARMLLGLVEGTRIGWCVRPDGSLETRVRLHIDTLLTSWGGGTRT